MSDLIPNSLIPPTSRRALLGAAAAGAAASLLPRSAWAADDKPTLVTSIRSLSNPYHAVWKEGAKASAPC